MSSKMARSLSASSAQDLWPSTAASCCTPEDFSAIGIQNVLRHPSGKSLSQEAHAQVRVHKSYPWHWTVPPENKKISALCLALSTVRSSSEASAVSVIPSTAGDTATMDCRYSAYASCGESGDLGGFPIRCAAAPPQFQAAFPAHSVQEQGDQEEFLSYRVGMSLLDVKSEL